MATRECMTEDVVSCSPDNTLVDVAKIMAEEDVGAVPVCEQNGQRRLVGMITDRDIVIRAVANYSDLASLRARDIMSDTIVAVRPGTMLDECCDAFERHKVRRIPVVGEHRELLGVITLADIARKQSETKAGELMRRVSEPTRESCCM